MNQSDQDVRAIRIGNAQKAVIDAAVEWREWRQRRATDNGIPWNTLESLLRVAIDAYLAANGEDQ